MNSNDQLPADAWVVALLSLPGLGPNRLKQLTADIDAKTAWKRLCDGGHVEVESVRSSTIDGWRSAARVLSVSGHWRAIHGLGISVMAHGASSYPERLLDDIEPPSALFALGGHVRALSRSAPSVAIIGTRECTSYGQRCAFELAASLTRSGVSVVSGLALGIDAAAHRGALSISEPQAAPPIGVVGSGLDIIYPRRNAHLWAAVAERGILLSETPPGVGPEKWRFPARNRIIAGLCDALVVVESHERGGSLLTVDEAQLRDVPVGVVPGPITSNAAAGTNRLLVDGATPILDADDVMALIGYSPPRVVERDEHGSPASDLLDVLGWTAQSMEQLCARINLPAAEVATEIERLVAGGLCTQTGPWIERVR